MILQPCLFSTGNLTQRQVEEHWLITEQQQECQVNVSHLNDLVLVK